jgi:hypothetical protein
MNEVLKLAICAYAGVAVYDNCAIMDDAQSWAKDV